jgi:tRNA G18 (ribose-2'-O)-methylase SpoU
LSIDDPRVSPYRNLKDRELSRQGGLFIAEGEHVVRRLLDSDYPTESLLLAERRVEEIGPVVPDDVPVYAAPDELMRQIVGFKFHSGMLACGRRKPPAPLEAVIPQDSSRLTLVVCPEIANAENMGAMVRICAAFGVDALVLGERCCDPFLRQAVRVSMGTIFRLPLVRSSNLLNDLRRLREEFGVQLAATVLAEEAEPLDQATRPARFGLLFGNEAQGLEDQYVRACDRRITIPMRMGTDSLNVSVAAAVFLYQLTRN